MNTLLFVIGNACHYFFPEYLNYSNDNEPQKETVAVEGTLNTHKCCFGTTNHSIMASSTLQCRILVLF